jgi:hypothetical protein
MEPISYKDSDSGIVKAERSSNESDVPISSSVSLTSSTTTSSNPRRTQQVFRTGTAPGVLTSASGTFMITQDTDKVFRLFDALSREVLWVCDSRKELYLNAYCHMSNKIVAHVTVTEHGAPTAYELAVWDLNTGKILLLLEAGDRRQRVHCIDRTGTRIIVSQGYNDAAMLDMETGSKLFQLHLNPWWLWTAFHFTRDDSRVAIASRLPNSDLVLAVWEAPAIIFLHTVTEDLIVPTHVKQVTSSVNNEMFAIATSRDIVMVDMITDISSVLSVPTNCWYSLCFGCDDTCIVAVGWDVITTHLGVFRIVDSAIRFWVPLPFAVMTEGSLCATASKIYLTGTEDGSRNIAYVFDYATGATLQQSSAYDYPIARMYVPEPLMILMGSFDYDSHLVLGFVRTFPLFRKECF